jgi:hypothetical protein
MSVSVTSPKLMVVLPTSTARSMPAMIRGCLMGQWQCRPGGVAIEGFAPARTCATIGEFQPPASASCEE